MTDVTTGESSGAPVPPEKSAKPASARPHKWRRRLLWTVAVILVITVVLRMLLAVLLPPVLQSVAGRYGLTCTYERTEIYLLDGDVGLWHLTLAPKGGGEPLLQSDYCRADIATLPLLRGRLVVRRAEAEGVDILAERLADGSIPLLKQFAIFSKPSSTVTSTEPAKTVDLSAPLRADAIRLQQVRLHVHDAAVSPAFDARMELQMRLTDLGSSSRPTRIGMDFTSLPALDLLRIEGEGRSTADALDLTADVAVFGLHPAAVEGYLNELGLKPAAHSIAMQAHATAHGAPGKTPGTVTGTINLQQASVSADGVESLGLDHLQLDIGSANETFAAISKLLITGVRGNATRGANGNLRIAGIDYAPELASPASNVAKPPSHASAEPSVAVANAPSAPVPAGKDWLPLSLDELQISDVALKFNDAAVKPAADLSLKVDQIQATHLLPGPGDAVAASNVLVHVLIPQVIGDIKITGSSQPGPERKMNFNVNATGIAPAALRPYLESVGIESQLKNATFTCVGEATFPKEGSAPGIVDAQLANLKLADGATLLELNSLHLSGLSVPALVATTDKASTNPGGIVVKSLEISGPHPTIRRNSDGSVEAFGFRKRFDGAAPQPAAATSLPSSQPQVAAIAQKPTTTPAVVMTEFPLPRLQVGHFAWKDLGVTFEDASLVPPTTFQITDAGFALDDLDLNPALKDQKPRPAKLHGWIKAPGLASELNVDGTLLPSASGPALNVNVNGLGLSGNMIAGVLKQAGIEPTMQDGKLSLKASIVPSLLKTGDGLGISLSASDVKLEDQNQALIAVKSVAIDDAEIRANSFTINSIKVNEPQARALREEDGSLVAAGFRLRAVQPTTRPTELQSAALQLSDPLGALLTALKATSARPITLRQLQITGASGAWEDRAVKPTIQLSGTADVSADALVIGADAPPGNWKISASAPGVAREVKIDGTLALKRNTAAAHAQVAIAGVTGEAVAAYLPAGIHPVLKDGKLGLSADVLIAPSEAGGSQAQFALNDVDYRDASDTSPLLHLDKGRIDIARFDTKAQVVALSNASAEGFEAELHTTAQGAMRAMGLEIGAGAAQTQPAVLTPAAISEPAGGATTRPAIVAVAVALPAANKAPTTLPSGAQVLQSLPLLTLDKLDLGARKITWVNEKIPDSKPVVLANVSVTNAHRIELLGNDPESRPPVDLKITGAIQPIADELALSVQLAPLASPATLVGELSINGIHGDGLLTLVPAFKDQVDASTLKDGRLHLLVDAQAKIAHRRPVGFDLSHGVEAEFSVRSIEFRDGVNGPLLAGLDEIRGEGIKADGKFQEIDIKSIEMTKPTGSALRDKDGLHAMGVVLKLPPAAMWGSPDINSTTKPASPPTAPAVVAKSAPPTTIPVAAKPTPIVRIDRLSISGVDFRYQDQVFVPHVLIPVAGLELEARDLSNQLMFEDKPFRWSLSANSAKMTLPVNTRTGSAANAKEERELFAQATSDGKVSLYPTMTGWAKASISALDLAGFRGVGHAIGVTLNGGNVDASTDLRFLPNKLIDTKEHVVITDLSVDEPANGPIAKALKLPIPLDGAIGAVEDPSGGITLPLSVPIKDGKLEGVDGQVIGAVASVFTTAIASAPVKLVSGLGDLFGGGGKAGKAGIEPVTLNFAAGDTGLSGADTTALTRLIATLRDDKNIDVTFQHVLGQGDVSRAALRANPSPEETRLLADNLRRHKLDLLTARAAAAGQARGELGSRPEEQAGDSLSNLRDIDRELARTDSALDRVYEMLRPGADRQADRRTRAATLEIAQERLDAVQLLLQSSGVPDIAQRIHLVKPTFNPADNTDGGQIVLVAIKKK